MCWSSLHPFIFYLFLVGVMVQSTESLWSAQFNWKSKFQKNKSWTLVSFSNAVLSVSSWLQSFYVCGCRTQSLSSVSGHATHWRCIRAWPICLLWAYKHDFAAILPFFSEKIGTLCRHPSWSLWLNQRTAGWCSRRSEGESKSFSTRHAFSLCNECPVWFPGDFTDSSHGATSI